MLGLDVADIELALNQFQIFVCISEIAAIIIVFDEMTEGFYMWIHQWMQLQVELSHALGTLDSRYYQLIYMRILLDCIALGFGYYLNEQTSP